jgi:hypothetical protein
MTTFTPTIADIAKPPYAGGNINGPTTYESRLRIPMAERALDIARAFIECDRTGDDFYSLVYLQLDQASPALVAATGLAVIELAGAEAASKMLAQLVTFETEDPIWRAPSHDVAIAWGSTVASDRAAGIVPDPAPLMPRHFIAVTAAVDQAPKICGIGLTADEALDRAYDAAGCRYHPYVRYDPVASGGRFDHLLDVADTEGWVAFDGHANEIGAFFEKDAAQRAADRSGFVARECTEALHQLVAEHGAPTSWRIVRGGPDDVEVVVSRVLPARISGRDESGRVVDELDAAAVGWAVAWASGDVEEHQDLTAARHAVYVADMMAELAA